jgi:hypothetical protein
MLLPEERLESLLGECCQLGNIIEESVVTAKNRQARRA